jgi:hypothetical protein
VDSDELASLPEITNCPHCWAPAEIVDRDETGTQRHPVELVRTYCIIGHWAHWSRARSSDMEDK